MNFKRLTALLIATIMLVCCVPFTSSAVTEDDFYELDYLFIGDEAKLPGYAQGIITVTPDSTGAKSGYYLVYYTDGLKVLPGYDELASAKITGDVVRIEVKDGTMIPEGAKGIAVFESTTKFLDNPPDISTAKARRIIPEHKRLTLSTPEFVFGLASDVHMNYEGVNPSRGAFEKWATALSFFKQNGATHVMVSGDMTGDRSDSTALGENFSLENQYKKYSELITAAGYTKNNVFECLGNHGNIQADLNLFTTYTSGSNEVHPYAGSPYYYVLLEGQNGAKDNLIIAMWQELDPNGEGGYKAGQSANLDNFSKAQIDWLEGLLQTYGNDPNTNVFILEHSAFRNYGAGEKYMGVYSGLVTFKNEYTQTMRLKTLLETYKDVTVFSGHTHESLYDGLNYSDMGGTFANTVHVSSTCWPRAYFDDGVTSADGRDGRYPCNADYGSEAYVVKVYKDYVVYTGYNLSTGKIIPAGCLIIPTKASTPSPDDAFEGSGTASDPYLIQNENDFLVFTNGMNQAATETAKYADGKYFKQTADINMIGVESYYGTHANGNSRRYFGGNYDGNGYEIKVSIKGPEQRSVFPYIYGTISNVVIRGDIVSENAVQPIRANRGRIINCIFDCYLQADNVNGMVYSNYSYVYNVFATGYMQGTNYYPVAMNDDAGATLKNVYYYHSNANGVIEDNVGVCSNDYTAIANAFNVRTGTDYNTAVGYIGSGKMSKAGVIAGTIKLGHDGNVPVLEIPTTGNVAGYGTYTTSQLYRQGGKEVDWGWDATAPITYPDEGGATLVDGKLATAAKYSDEAWIGFHAKAPDAVSAGYHTVKFTFNKSIPVTSINVYVGTSDLGNGIDSPDSIEVLCDNVSVTTVKPSDTTNVSGIGTEKVTIPVNKEATTVELRFKNDSWVMVSEVEIYTGKIVHNCVSNGGNWISDKNGHWHLCQCGEKVDESQHSELGWHTVKNPEIGVEGKREQRCGVCGFVVKEETIPALEEGHTCTADGKGWYSDANNHWNQCDCGEKLNKTSHTAGQWKVVKEAEIGVDGKKELRCKTCNYLMDEEIIPALQDGGSTPGPDPDPDPDPSTFIRGDVNLNGKIDSRDYLLLKRAYFGTTDLNEIATLAADVNKNDKIDSRDYMLLKRAYFGTYTIEQ